MSRLRIGIPLGLLLLLGLLFGLPRLELDVDLFNLLPSDSPMVEGLKLYQRSFGSSREMIVSVNAEDADAAGAAAESLAAGLRDAGLTTQAIWRSPFGEDPGAVAELLAYVWFNRRPEEFRDLADRFEDERLAPTVEATLERLAVSLNPREIARLSRDPFALSDLPADLASLLAGGKEDPFASADGSFRVLFLHPPFEEGNFWDQRRWVRQVRDHVDAWRLEPAHESVAVRLTGDPVFIAEIGSGMLGDMRLAALGTLSIVAALFWLAHRRWAPLVWMVSLLLFIVTATVVIGGAVLGSLNAVSLGFAAILLGLAADYGLILYQEYVADPGRSVSDHRSAIAPSILWAAATTAGAFVMISRSSLPGLTQLGALVAIGISLAALVMLIAFLPPIARRRLETAERTPDAPPVTTGDPLGGRPGALTAWTVTLVVATSSVAVIANRPPAVDYGTEGLGSGDGEARSAIEELHQRIGGGDEPLWLIVSGNDEADVADRLVRTRALLDEAVEDETLGGFKLPDAIWPRPETQRSNRETALALSARLPAALRVAAEHGFTEDALRLTRQVFGAWESFATTEGVVWPRHPGSRWAFHRFASTEGPMQLALARLDAAESAGNEELLALAERLGEHQGVTLFSWSLLSESLLETMQRDVRRVLVPMGLMLLVILFVAFRRFHEITLSLATLGFSLLCLFAVMAVFDWSWNLMNVMALPLLFGAGIDYSIHVQLALRRHKGDAYRVRRTVGRAILLCGASTAAGFGTLALASNDGLASLGRVCASGIVIASLTSVVLLPVWWRTLGRGHGMRAASRLATVLAMALVTMPANGEEQIDPTPVVEAWLEQQTGIETWSADVVQTRTIKSLARPLVSHGKVWFLRPNRFRWQLGDPPRTIAVRTREELVLLYPTLKQAERFSLGEQVDPAWRQALTLLEVGFPSDRESFYAGYEPISATRSGETWKLALRPAGEQARRLLQEVHFELTGEDYTLSSTELVFTDGSTMRNDFEQPRLNPRIDPDLFEVVLGEDWTTSHPLEQKR